MIGMNVAVSVASEGTVSVQFTCLAQSKKVPGSILCGLCLSGVLCARRNDQHLIKQSCFDLC